MCVRACVDPDTRFSSSTYNDPFLLLTALVRDEIKLKKYDLNSLDNNLVVVEILDAARTSAKENKTVFID